MSGNYRNTSRGLLSFILTMTREGRYWYPHFRGGNWGSEWLSDLPKGTQLIKGRNRPPFCPPPKSTMPWSCCPFLPLALSFRMDQRMREYCGGGGGQLEPQVWAQSPAWIWGFSLSVAPPTPIYYNLWGSPVGPSLHHQGIEDRGPINEPWFFSRPGRGHKYPLHYSFLFLLPSLLKFRTTEV